MTTEGKASVVGFHCPVCGTTEIRFLLVLVLVIMLDPIQVDFDHEHEHENENDDKADQWLARLLRQPK